MRYMKLMLTEISYSKESNKASHLNKTESAPPNPNELFNQKIRLFSGCAILPTDTFDQPKDGEI